MKMKKKNENDENEKQNKLLNNDNSANVKNQKTSTNTKKATNKEDENKNIFLEYMGDVDDKLFKEYSNGKNSNSFISEFVRATNEEDKEKVVKELKNINSLVKHYSEINENSEYRSKLFDIVNAIDYFLYEYSKKYASDFNWGKQSKIMKHFM